MVGLWAASAAAAAPTVQANYSVVLDGGTAFARAYVVPSDGGQWAIAGTGGDLRTFDTSSGNEVIPGQLGPFSTFAVASYTVGASVVNVVVGANVGPNCPTTCLDISFWDSTNHFGPVTGSPIVLNLPAPTAMAIDATSSPIRIYLAGSNPVTLYEQDITFAANGSVSSGSFGSLFINTAIVRGLTFNSNNNELLLADTNSNLYTVTGLGNPDVSAGTLTLYRNTSTGGYSQLEGVFFYPDLPAPYLLGGGVGSGVYGLDPLAAANAPIVLSSVQVVAVGGRQTQPSSASVNAAGNVTLVTEDPGTLGANTPARLHIVLPSALIWDGGVPIVIDAGPDGGTDGGGAGGTDAGPDSGIPTIPIIPPGQGQLTGTVNSCNCSTAGSAPILLALLLPLFLPRRRR